MEKRKEIHKVELIADIEKDSKTVLFDHIQENNEEHDQFSRDIQNLDIKIENIQLTPGEKGDKGDKGEPGEKPVAGIDYPIPENGKDGKDGKIPVKGIDYDDGKDGEPGQLGEKGEKGDIPDHHWEGTKLQFEKPDHSWGDLVDLKGDKGEPGMSTPNYSLGASYPGLKRNGELLTTGFREINFITDLPIQVSGTAVNVTILSGTVTGSGTTNTIPKWTSSTSLGDSLISESGSSIIINGNLLPNTDNTRTLGSDSVRWSTGFFAGLIETKGISDDDGDTMVQVEQSADDDIIRFTSVGQEVGRIWYDTDIAQGISQLNGLTGVDSGYTTIFRLHGTDTFGRSVNANQVLTWNDNLYLDYEIGATWIDGHISLTFHIENTGANAYATLRGDFRPTFDDVLDLGLSSQRWRTLWLSGDLNLDSDTSEIFLGADQDASIVYNGTNLVINPKVVGSGMLSVLGDIAIPTTEKLFLNGTGGGVEIYNTTTTINRLVIDPQADGTQRVVTIGTGIISANPAVATRDWFAIMPVLSSTTVGARAALMVAEYSGTGTNTVGFVGLNAGALLTNSGTTDLTGGRYFVRAVSSSATGTITLGGAVSAQVANTTSATATWTEAYVYQVEAMAALTGTITLGSGIKFVAPTKSTAGTFTEYNGILFPFMNQGTTATPTSVRAIFFTRNSGGGATNSIHFGEVTTTLGSANANILDFSAATGGSYRFNINSALELTIAADTMTFNAGTVDPVFNWGTDGFLNLTTGRFSVQVGTSASLARVGGVLFDHFADVGNVGTGEDDLYTDTTPANTLTSDGDKITAEYAGIFVSSATATRRLRAYFGGTVIYDSTALSLSTSSDWNMSVTIIRESSTVVRCTVKVNTTTASSAPYTTYTRITGLTLSNTNIIKITGEAAGVGAATDDIVAKLGYVEWKPAD